MSERSRPCPDRLLRRESWSQYFMVSCFHFTRRRGRNLSELLRMSWIESIELSHWIMMKDMKHVLYWMIEWWKGMMSCCQAMQVFFQRCSPAGLHESLAPVWCIGNSFVPSSFFLLLERKGQEIMEILMTLYWHLDLQRIWMSTAVDSLLAAISGVWCETLQGHLWPGIWLKHLHIWNLRYHKMCGISLSQIIFPSIVHRLRAPKWIREVQLTSPSYTP